MIAKVLGDDTITGLPLAFFLGLVVGIEREWRGGAVGIRACVLISLAAAAFADLVISEADPTGYGAGLGAIATGVGFLGAGAILREGRSVRGLSAAATIWCLAGIGALAGAAHHVDAVWLTLIVVLVNVVLRPIQVAVRRRRGAVADPEQDALEA